MSLAAGVRRLVLIPTIATLGIIGAATGALADRDVWVYILVGDGIRQGVSESILDALAPDEYDAIVGLAAHVFLDTWLYDMIGPAQRQAFLNTASRMRSAFVSGWNVPAGQVEEHHAWAMTLSDFYATLRSFARHDDGDGEDLFVFYYLGHGMSDSFCPLFRDEDDLSYGNLTDPGLVCGNSGTWSVILDCCHSGTVLENDILKREAYIVTSVGDTTGLGWHIPVVGVLAFSDALGQAISEGEDLVYAYEDVVDSTSPLLLTQLSRPRVSIPAGVLFHDGSAGGYSVSCPSVTLTLLSVSPRRGTTLFHDETVLFSVTIAYAFKGAGLGWISVGLTDTDTSQYYPIDCSGSAGRCCGEIISVGSGFVSFVGEIYVPGLLKSYGSSPRLVVEVGEYRDGKCYLLSEECCRFVLDIFSYSIR